MQRLVDVQSQWLDFSREQQYIYIYIYYLLTMFFLLSLSLPVDSAGDGHRFCGIPPEPRTNSESIARTCGGTVLELAYGIPIVQIITPSVAMMYAA